MRLTIVGSGDAFGSGGRFNTAFLLETAKGTLLIDCGASTMVALKARNLDPNRIDAIVLSHLHGDHYGGLPFFMLDAQFLSRRERALLVAGPPGTRARIPQAMEAFFPLSTLNKWRFPWRVVELDVGASSDVLGHTVTTAEVVHFSGAPSTAVRICDGERVFVYSGDTEWVETLPPIAKDANLLVVECYNYSGQPNGHLTWEVLKPRLGDLHARAIMLTHMNPTMLASLDEMRAHGLLIAEDGAVHEIE